MSSLLSRRVPWAREQVDGRDVSSLGKGGVASWGAGGGQDGRGGSRDLSLAA